MTATHPRWIQRSFEMDIDRDEWRVSLNRLDVETMLDFAYTCDTHQHTQVAYELGAFIMEQMRAFRITTDRLTLTEMDSNMRE